MGLETGTYVDDLVAANPVGASDDVNLGDNHLRLIKAVLKSTFPNATRASRFEVILTKTGAYTVLATDEHSLVEADATGGGFTVTLPLGSNVFAGYTVSIVKKDSSSNVVVIDGNGSETINGVTTLSLSDQYRAAILEWTGSEWRASTVTPDSMARSDVVGQQTIWFGAGVGEPETSAGPSIVSVEQAADNLMVTGWAFDPTTAQALQIPWQAPKGYNGGTLILQFIWWHTTTTVNFGVSWEAKGVSLGDGDNANATFGSAVNTDDTGGSTSGYKLYISPESGALTVTNAAAEELMIIKITRDVGDAADTLAVDAVLAGIRIHYTTDAPTDD